MDTISLGMGIFLFSLLSFISVLGTFLVGIFLFEIKKKSGWEVVGLVFLILLFSVLTGIVFYVGGDQIVNGYHLY